MLVQAGSPQRDVSVHLLSAAGSVPWLLECWRRAAAWANALAEAGGGGSSGGRQQQQLAGDWQGAEDGLSDVELELLLAEFAYVEQVVVLAEAWCITCQVSSS